MMDVCDEEEILPAFSRCMDEHCLKFCLIPYFTLLEMRRFVCVSTSIRKMVDEERFYLEFMIRKILSAPPLTRDPLVAYIKGIPMINFKTIVKYLVNHAKGGPAWSCLLKAVTGVSSVDRENESPENLLQCSQCITLLEEIRHYHVFADSANMTEVMGFHAQLRCGCAGAGRPCYWSSAPQRAPNATEHISFSLVSPLCYIHAFAVTPYQAFFHPLFPIYNPRTASIQFLSPDDNSLSHGECYHETAQFPIESFFKRQVFILPRPILAVGGRVRVMLRGMIQRQTLQGVNDNNGQAMDDYYMCLSEVCLFGLPLIATSSSSTKRGNEGPFLGLSPRTILETKESDHECFRKFLDDVIET